MKQLLFLQKARDSLRVKASVLADVIFPVEDIISPQKTTFTIQKQKSIEGGDIVIAFEDDINDLEYVGIVESVSTTATTTVSCYPIVMAFDNDFVLEQMFQEVTNQDGTKADGPVEVVSWLMEQIKREFIDTKDPLQALPLEIVNVTNTPALLKKIIETANLYEVYSELFVETGVYLKFPRLTFDGSTIKAIVCEVHNNNEEDVYSIWHDFPNIQDAVITDNTFQGVNKIIATPETGGDVPPNADVGERFYFYLLKDNSITTDPNHPDRIKQVKSKEITYSLESYGGSDGVDAEETVKALMTAVYNELQAPEYDLKIEMTMLDNDLLTMCRKVEFHAKDGTTYYTNITKIERLSQKQVKVTLGALRNSLVDFKKRVEAI